MAELEDEIRAAAASKKKLKSHAGEQEEHSLKDLADASHHLAGQEAISQPHFGIRFTKLVPPGGGFR